MSKGYLSEFSVFMKKYHEDNPEAANAQQVGRNSMWKDKHEAITPVTKQDQDASKKS